MRSVGLCYYCVIGNQSQAPEKIKALYAFYWFLRQSLVKRRATPQHTAWGHVLVGVGRHAAMMSGENNTINHRSWNISLSFFNLPRSWTVLMTQVGSHLHQGCNGKKKAERTIDLPPRLFLIVVIKNWTIEAANRAWWFLLGSRKKKQQPTNNQLFIWVGRPTRNKILSLCLCAQGWF